MTSAAPRISARQITIVIRLGPCRLAVVCSVFIVRSFLPAVPTTQRPYFVPKIRSPASPRPGTM